MASMLDDLMPLVLAHVEHPAGLVVRSFVR
jgi:hypothetical protein